VNAAGLIIAGLAGLLTLGVTIEWFERRVDRRRRDADEAADHVRLMRELDRHR
jgi:hypothetical protein